MITAHLVLSNTETGRSAQVRSTQVYYVAETFNEKGKRVDYYRSTVFGKAAGKAYRWVKDE